jgi:anti-sigma-K factor RskA
MTRDDCARNAAAYVLGALEAGETAAYERHLQACAVCTDEVTSLRRVTEALPRAAPQYRVPAGLRRRVVRSVRAESRNARVRPRLRPALAGAFARAFAIVLVVAAAAGILARGGGAGPKLIDAGVRGSTGTAELRITGGHADLIVHHLPAPRSGRIYEVWLERLNSAPAPTSALFSVTAGGAAVVGVPGDLRGVTHILVTQEPAGGSREPTSPAVIVADL